MLFVIFLSHACNFLVGFHENLFYFRILGGRGVPRIITQALLHSTLTCFHGHAVCIFSECRAARRNTRPHHAPQPGGAPRARREHFSGHCESRAHAGQRTPAAARASKTITTLYETEQGLNLMVLLKCNQEFRRRALTNHVRQRTRDYILKSTIFYEFPSRITAYHIPYLLDFGGGE